jgi:hypothetical protein
MNIDKLYESSLYYSLGLIQANAYNFKLGT